jgi:hypothetical protein
LFLKVYTAALLAWKLVTAMVRSFVLLVTCLRQRLLFDLFLFADEEPVSWFVFLQQVRKGPVLNQLYFRAIKDIQYVMSHLEVTQYIAQECQELARAWLHLLALCKACILGTWVLILVTGQDTNRGCGGLAED